MTSLIPLETYYARAYATNLAGTVYGDDIQFTTLQLIIPGNVNGDIRVDLVDAILSLQVVTGLTPNRIYFETDVDNDQKIGIPEAIYVLKDLGSIEP